MTQHSQLQCLFNFTAPTNKNTPGEFSFQILLLNFSTTYINFDTFLSRFETPKSLMCGDLKAVKQKKSLCVFIDVYVFVKLISPVSEFAKSKSRKSLT